MSELTSMQTIEHVNGGKRFLLVEVPERAKGFKVVSGIGLRYSYESGCMEGLVIPPGEWQIVGKADQLSEEQFAEIVRKKGTMFKDYLINGEPYHSAKMSLDTLLLSLNLQPSTTIILKAI